MTKICDLPRDLAEEVLSKVPVTSLRSVRLACKKLNTLSKDRSFIKKHFVESKKTKNKDEFQMVMMLEYRVYLLSVNLLLYEPRLEPIGKLISLDDTDRVDIVKIYNSDGLLLCITEDINSRLVVWNHYYGETRLIKPRNSYHKYDRYALGYENNNHKILRFIDTYDICEFEMYDLNSDSWKVLDVTPDWDIEINACGLTLKGNTYWFAQEKLPPRVVRDLPGFLLCFDFTTERFGSRLPLPFQAFEGDIVTLSSVREKQLAVLIQKRVAPALFTVKIWITTKIEPNAVSWSNLFLSFDMGPLLHLPLPFRFGITSGSFFIDEEKKLAVVLDKDKGKFHVTRYLAYIIGTEGYFKIVDLGVSIDRSCFPHVCSYVPSSVQIKKPAPRGSYNTP